MRKWSLPSSNRFNLTVILVAVILMLAAVFRWQLIRQGNVLFWFDQGRDAIVVQDMVNSLDLKIQGPSASGTNDSVHHGVLYYYLIAPLYLVLAGNPFLVSFALGLLSLLTLLPITWLTYRFTNSKLAALSTIVMYSFSFEATQTGTWLSNPVITLVSIPFFFFFLWRIFWEKKYRELPLLALTLGVSHQAAIYTIFLFGTLFTTLFIFWRSGKKSFPFSLRQILLSLGVYLATVSTMILNQLLLLQRGIFDPFSTLAGLNNDNIGVMSLITTIINLYSKTISWSLFPTKPLLSILLLLVLLGLGWKKIDPKIRVFLLLWFTAPLWLLGFQARESYHTLMGITPAIFILLPLLIEVSIPKYKQALLLGVVLSLFVVTNVQQLQASGENRQHVLAVQAGTSLQDKLKLIDYTYEVAEGKPFSISSFTSPYLYNTTWSYLYSWYGQKTYGYTPSFWGASQAGMFGDGRLETTDKPLDLHFALYEPQTGIPESLFTTFVEEQNAYSELENERTYGSMKVELRTPRQIMPISNQ